MNLKLQNFIQQYQDQPEPTRPAVPDNHMHVLSKADWILHSHLPWMELIGLEPPYQDMLNEARALKHIFVEHRSDEGQHQGWRSLCIHGISATKTNVAENYGLDSKTAKYDWTEIQDQCPATVKFFKEVFPYRHYMRLRFMLLEPGGYIMPHQDHHESMLGTAINISLNNPSGCKLVNTQGTLPFRNEGSVFFFNNNYPHCVYNGSNEDRFHIIVHGGADMERLAPLIVKSYE